MKRAAFFLGLLVSLAVQCTRPPEGPNTAYPCGVWGVECGDGTCCPWAHVCGDSKGYGSFNRCHDGYCCADVDPFWGATPDAGASRSIIKSRKPR